MEQAHDGCCPLSGTQTSSEQQFQALHRSRRRAITSSSVASALKLTSLQRSSFMPLAAGDVIVTGTPGGVGAKRTPPVWMKAGDIVEVEVDAIGVLRNGVRAE
ncbi:fumarylacetoacetate hydrolase family protein [Variovorax sp. LT1R20]|uniref:fumarylacetoacetate hydrolase family protein n=1 Tax=Variovorax sp. LT1R20 TaxID=3443729 RepID=UPI003F462C0D